MSGVMDINHLLCHPCDPYVSKNYIYHSPPPVNNQIFIQRPVPIMFNDTEFWKHNRSLSTASNSSSSSEDKPKPNYRKRINSDSKFIMVQSKQSTRRNRSNSTSMIQTRVPWTPEEDDLLQKGYEQGLSWAMISFNFLPHRSRGCCWGRFKTLQNKNVIEVYQHRVCQRPWRINRPHSKSVKN
ncbi:uncharacterized protein B0P05DRAFT_571596 [Gilbertella persicaria]|uniref:uncharacterized protein n=1 Tax=Gilbertella persicaria TaxID=101096 RepID=UPI00221F7A25|nr:uncharacterized protein B0P05DRAFT_571596 [Gilbertella persicaria]KAI8079692.1 hypothetical protein B0P05DRAFT_571596 [Gilbertella persicaria]